MELPDLPKVNIYGNAEDAYLFILIKDKNNRHYFRCGFENQHADIKDLFDAEVWTSIDQEPYSSPFPYDNYEVMGGGYCRLITKDSPFLGRTHKHTQANIWDKSTRFGQADPDLVKRVLEESSLFEKVEIGNPSNSIKRTFPPPTL